MLEKLEKSLLTFLPQFCKRLKHLKWVNVGQGSQTFCDHISYTLFWAFCMTEQMGQYLNDGQTKNIT